MEVEVFNQRENSLARVILQANEVLMAQAGTLVAMKGDLKFNTTLRRSSGKSHPRSSGPMTTESLFITECRGLSDRNEVWLAPWMMGNIIVHSVTEYKLISVMSAYLGCSGSMELFLGLPEVKIPNQTEPFTLLSITGKGQVLLNGMGGIYPIDVDGEYLVNLNHLVAFENSLHYEITEFATKGLSSWLTKKTLGMKLIGRGKLYCQTHQDQFWGHLISSQLKVQ